MLGCAAVVTVPAVVAEPDTVMVYVPLSRAAFSVPDEMLVALIVVTLAPDPLSVPTKLPDVVLPVTASELNVPTEVMLGCAAVVTVPAVVALVTDIEYDPVNLALGTVPDAKLVAFRLETLAPDPFSVPTKLPEVVLPVTANAVNVPTEVMLGCAAVVTVPALVTDIEYDPVNLALGTVPDAKLVAFRLETLAPDPFNVPTKLPLVVLPVTASELNVPTEVMLGCAAVVTVPAVVALDTVPVTLPPGILVSPVAAP
jgi:hypothetical protein